MSKFFKVYKASGYPVDPKLEEERMHEEVSKAHNDFYEKFKNQLHPWQKSILKELEKEQIDLEKGFIARNIFIAN